MPHWIEQVPPVTKTEQEPLAPKVEQRFVLPELPEPKMEQWFVLPLPMAKVLHWFSDAPWPVVA